MGGLSSIFSLGKKALLSNQVGIHVTGENIANAQNPDYSRQRVNLVSDSFVHSNQGFIGSGVKVNSVDRIRDRFYDSQVWEGKSQLAEWKSGGKYGNLIQSIFADLDNSGLSTQLNAFWNAWEDLGNHPGDYGIRNDVRLKAQGVVNQLHGMNSRLRSVSDNALSEIQGSLVKINDLIDQIADTNKKIANTAFSENSNTLLDRRDALIDKLSEYIDVVAIVHENGTVSVLSSYNTVVDQSHAYSLTLDVTENNGYRKASLLVDGTMPVEMKSGQLKNLMDIFSTGVPDLLQKLDTITESFVNKVNQIHGSNYSLYGENGISLFTDSGISSGSIQISQQVQNDVANIAVSKSGQTGDGAGALAISNLRYAKLLSNGDETLDDYYRSMVAKVGDYAQNMQDKSENYSAVVNMMENQRDSIKGVSLEEEMVDMIKFQNSFNAASKIITTVDELMQTVIGMVR